MKKVILFFTFLACHFSVFAALPNGNGEFEVKAPIFNGGFELGATAFLLEPSLHHFDYALSFQTPPTPFRDEGKYRSVRPNYDFGYEVYAGYFFACTGNDVKLTYREYEQKESDHIGNVDPGGEIFATLTTVNDVPVAIPEVTATVTIISGLVELVVPGVTIFEPSIVTATGSLVAADATDKIRQGSVDLDLGQYIDIDTFIRVRLFGGLRYSRLKEELVANYILGNFVATQTQTLPLSPLVPGIFVESTMTLTSTSQLQELVSQTNKFEGIGPRFGTEGWFHLGGGFGIVGSLSTAMLIGNAQSALSTNVNGSVDLTLVSIDPEVIGATPGSTISLDAITPPIGTVFSNSISETEFFDYDKRMRIVPNIEAKIGLNYTTQFNNCRTFSLEIGYFVNHYFNGLDRLSAVGIDNPALNPRHTMDVGFAGPYVELSATL